MAIYDLFLKAFIQLYTPTNQPTNQPTNNQQPTTNNQ